MIPEEIRRMKPLTGKERLGANRDSEYLGAEDIDPGTEPILTIKAIYNGMVTLQRGKENKDVIVFAEESVPGIKTVRPLIVNATNRKTLRKLYKSVTADTLQGKAIQLYIDHNVRDPSSGDKIDGIRIKPRIPSPPRTEPIICESCGKHVEGVGTYSAEDVARLNQKRYGKTLCAACSKAMSEAAQVEQAEPESTETEKEETSE